MAFPSVRSTNSATLAASTSIAYPATIVAGDILLMVGSSSTSSAESGWTLISSYFTGGTYLKVQYTVATGSESGNLSLGSSTGGRWMAAIDTGGTAPEAATDYSASTDVPNPPSLSPSAGARDYLWIAYGSQSTGFSSSGVPSGWTQLSRDQQFLGATIVAYLQSNAASLDPAAFTDGDASNGVGFAATIALWFTPATVVPNPLFFGGGI